MKVTVTKPTHVYVLNGTVEVTDAEAHRLMMLGACEIIAEKETKNLEVEVKEVKKETKKVKAVK